MSAFVSKQVPRLVLLVLSEKCLDKKLRKTSPLPHYISQVARRTKAPCGPRTAVLFAQSQSEAVVLAAVDKKTAVAERGTGALQGAEDYALALRDEHLPTMIRGYHPDDKRCEGQLPIYVPHRDVTLKVSGMVNILISLLRRKNAEGSLDTVKDMLCVWGYAETHRGHGRLCRAASALTAGVYLVVTPVADLYRLVNLSLGDVFVELCFFWVFSLWPRQVQTGHVFGARILDSL